MRLCAHAFMVSVAFLPMGVHALVHWHAHARPSVGSPSFAAGLAGGKAASPEARPLRCRSLALAVRSAAASPALRCGGASLSLLGRRRESGRRPFSYRPIRCGTSFRHRARRRESGKARDSLAPLPFAYAHYALRCGVSLLIVEFETPSVASGLPAFTSASAP